MMDTFAISEYERHFCRKFNEIDVSLDVEVVGLANNHNIISYI